VKIICLEGWETGAPDYRVNKFDLVNPEGKTSLYTPTYMRSDMALDKFASKFHEELKRELNLMETESRAKT
jgi:hypothetical protein